MSGSGSSAQFEGYGRSKSIAGRQVLVSRNTRPVPQPEPREETPWRIDNEELLGYRVSGQPAGTSNRAQQARVDVAKPRTEYKHTGELSRADATFALDAESDLKRWQVGDGPDKQGGLFNVWHRKPHVKMMTTHPDMRAHIPTLLGIAAIETQARYREPLRSDTDLSEQSSRMVHRLAEAGAVKAPENETRNNMHIDDPTYWAGPTKEALRPDVVSDVPRATVNMGRQFTRDTLRRTRKSATRSSAPLGGSLKGKQEPMF